MDAQCLVYSAVNWFYVCFKAKSDVTKFNFDALGVFNSAKRYISNAIVVNSAKRYISNAIVVNSAKRYISNAIVVREG